MREQLRANLLYYRQRPLRWFFFGVLFFLLYSTGRMLAAFYLPLMAAGILAMGIYPVHRRVLRRWPQRPSAVAAATAAGTLLIVVLPLCGLAWVLFHEAPLVAPTARQWWDSLGAGSRGRLDSWLEAANPWLSAWKIDPAQILLGDLEALGTHLTGVAAAVVRNLLLLLVDLAVLGISLFFFLRDGPAGIRALFHLVPLPPQDKETLRARVEDTVIGVMRAVLGVAALQGFLAGIGLALFHVPFPVLLAALTALAAPIPVIGVGVILGPITVCLALAGATTQAWGVGLWSLIVVSGAEQVLKPFVISLRAKLPLWLLLLAILGGMRLYGFAGLLIGPVLVALALSLAGIYRREYSRVLHLTD